jgi:hypothetical protein
LEKVETIWLIMPKPGQDQDVHLGMAEEPEEVLEQHRVAAARRVEEGGAEIAVGQQHGDARRPAPAATAAAGRRSPGPTTRTAASCSSVMPGARMLKMVVMKLIGPRIERGAGEMQREDRPCRRRAGMADALDSGG